MPDDISTGELGRRLDFLERMMERRFRETNEAIRDMQFVHKEVYISDMGAMQARIVSLELRDKEFEAREKERENDKKKVMGWVVTGAILPIMVVIILQLLQLN